jgi:hypothetical protein
MPATILSPYTKQSGNALFLILIAVVLFAALTYAVTQSNRGSESSARETNAISSSSTIQFPTATRTGITRILMRGFSVAEVRYNRPTDAANYDDGATSTMEQRQVFHPDGGGVAFSNPDGQAVTDVTNATWVFNTNAGTSADGVGTPTADHIMFLTNLKGAVCQQIMNQLYGQGTAIPSVTQTRANIIGTYDATNGTSNTTAIALTAANGQGVAGRAAGCFTTAAPIVNVYYQVIIEQ